MIETVQHRELAQGEVVKNPCKGYDYGFKVGNITDLYKTESDLQSFLDFNARNVASFKRTQEREVEKARLEQEKIDAFNSSELGQFLDTFTTPMAKQKARNTLTRRQGFNGEFMARHEFIERNTGRYTHGVGNTLYGEDNIGRYEITVTKTAVDYFNFLKKTRK